MYWLNLWLNPLRVSPLVGGRWVFRFPFSFFSCASRTGTWRMVRAPRVGSVCRTREAERAVEVPWITICGPVRQPAADQRDCRLWPPLQGKAQ